MSVAATTRQPTARGMPAVPRLALARVPADLQTHNFRHDSESAGRSQRRAPRRSTRSARR